MQCSAAASLTFFPVRDGSKVHFLFIVHNHTKTPQSHVLKIVIMFAL